MMGMHIVVISTDQKGTNIPLVIEINTIGLKSHIINALLTSSFAIMVTVCVSIQNFICHSD